MQRILQDLNINLRNKITGIPTRKDLRDKLQVKMGIIKSAKSLSKREIEELFRRKPLLGVDGSLYSYGSNFPYRITLFKALAKSTSKGEIERIDVTTPLLERFYTEIERYAVENKISVEAADQKLREIKMAEMEVEVALEGIKKYKPRILLLDGGFLRFQSLVPDKWNEFKKLCLQSNCIPVGVIEEIGTFEIRKLLGNELPETCRNSYDRELLYGLFSPGEWLEVFEDLVLKRNYYTCFGRLGSDPQACAWDFLREHKDLVEPVINYLHTITPRQSRGIPLWIDIVDSEVRLTRKKVDLILDGTLDADLKELFFRPAREKRDI